MKCTTCNGFGCVVVVVDHGAGPEYDEAPCPTCTGDPTVDAIEVLDLVAAARTDYAEAAHAASLEDR